MTKMSPLPVGTVAPDFTLKSTSDKTVCLSDFRGKNVILAFYPADWSPVCGDQLALYQQLLPEFEKHDAQLLGISVDGAWCHDAYAQNRNLHFPLLADFFPHGGVSESYGVLSSENGMSGRALFVIDKTGKIAWSFLTSNGINPGADGILTALEALSQEVAAQ